jgi:hypothetical protein
MRRRTKHVLKSSTYYGSFWLRRSEYLLPFWLSRLNAPLFKVTRLAWFQKYRGSPSSIANASDVHYRRKETWTISLWSLWMDNHDTSAHRTAVIPLMFCTGMNWLPIGCIGFAHGFPCPLLSWWRILHLPNICRMEILGSRLTYFPWILHFRESSIYPVILGLIIPVRFWLGLPCELYPMSRYFHHPYRWNEPLKVLPHASMSKLVTPLMVAGSLPAHSRLHSPISK